MSFTIQKQVAKFKLVFIGDQAVGKTSIINRFIYDNFPGTHQPTVGIDFISKCMKVDNKTLRLQLWDTAGQERFRSLIPSYIRDSNVAVICFDVLHEGSFQNVSRWLDYVREERGNEVIVVLVGNKIDCPEERTVSKEDAEKFARENELVYFEVSAKDGTNIQQLFKSIAQLLVGDMPTEQDSQVQQQENQQPSGKVNLTTKTPTPEESRNCQC